MNSSNIGRCLKINSLTILFLIGISLLPISTAVAANGVLLAQNTGGGTVSNPATGGGSITNPATGGGSVKNPATGDTTVFTLQNPLKVDSIGDLVKTLIQIFSYLAVLFAVIVFIWIGFRYIVAAASGDSGTISKLHSWLMWAVIGLAVVIAARVIVDVVINTLSATGTVDPKIIDSARNANK